jgi:hypothetical protein
MAHVAKTCQLPDTRPSKNRCTEKCSCSQVYQGPHINSSLKEIDIAGSNLAGEKAHLQIASGKK